MPQKWEIYFFRFFIFWFAIGVVLLSFDLVPPWLEWANIVFLVTSGLLGILFFFRSANPVLGLFLAGTVFVLSMVIESIGVHTGLYFGDYSYQTDFGPKIAGVPVTIGFAWVMVIATSHVLAAPAVHLLPAFRRTFYAGYAALIAVTMDLAIDPVAFDVKQYWIWHDGGLYYDIPFSNFAGWFFLSFVLHLVIAGLLFRGRDWYNGRSVFWTERMYYLYGMMTGMFIIISLVNGLFLAAGLAGGLTVLYYYLHRLMKRRLEDD
ncbi:carotenoid biosynthesis protein [Alkalicoccus chagannorensis]|uniref:carotenoid biosynthesis protein n=1 Tax=Alkalicoccus chagannorensis TaxID=427072 RepID=UPI0003F5862D|nr:carotenoid biosynthesis protein [Alkalicoccus chagannorensis]